MTAKTGKTTLMVLVKNHFGVLTKVSSLFGRRGLNIHSLTVFPEPDGEDSLMTIVAEGAEEKLIQVYNQLEKLEDVKSINRKEGEAR